MKPSSGSGRVFEARDAVRVSTPLLIGLVGPSGSGKTYSSLELATGIQRVCPGPIVLADSEAMRALAYAGLFTFKHVPFAAPFGSLDYLELLRYCVGLGASTVIVDSMSHEHEGEGGYLMSQAAELDRIAGDNWEKRQKAGYTAWIKPARERRVLINGFLQLKCNFIFCFRAKEKLKIEAGKNPVDLGWQAIAGEEFVYEMSLKGLLLPGCDGTPEWQPLRPGEKALAKLPVQFREIFAKRPQLTADIGEQLARWAAGAAANAAASPRPAAPPAADPKPAPDPDPGLLDFVNAYADVSTWEELSKLEAQRKQIWDKLNARDKQALKGASDAAAKRIGKGASR